MQGKRSKSYKGILTFFSIGFFCIIVFVAIFIFLVSPPMDFPENTVITVDKGQSLAELSKSLKEKKLIRSAIFLNNAVILFDGERKVVAGDYIFKEPVTVAKVAKRITEGDFGVEPLKVTFPEGLNIFEYAEIARKYLPQFNPVEFLERARGKEGYLFPDTYVFLSNANAEDVLEVMEATFMEKIKGLAEDIDASGRSLGDIIIMASIIEGEAQTPEARRIVSGILWDRLDEGMPLQVDSTFKYVNGKNTYELTLDDLEIDSPYNTYKFAGLPETPISNPGLDSILAALHPTETPYLYFLSDRVGGMYYAKTFEEHKRNKEKYLDKEE